MAEGLGTLRELVVKLGFEVDEHALEGIHNHVEQLKHGLEILTLAWDAAVVGVFELVHQTADLGHEIEATAEVVGLSVEQYQKYRYAADLAGLGADRFTTAVSILTRNVGEAVHGMGTAGIAFRALGVRFTDGQRNARSTSEILDDLQKAFSNVKSPAEQARLSTELFGRSGLRMGALLAQGGFKIKEISDEVQAFGFFSEEKIQEAEKVHGSLRAFFAILRGIRNELAFHLFGAVKGVSDRFRAWALAHKDVINSRLEQFAKVLVTFIERGADMVVKMVHALSQLVKWLGGAENATKLLGVALGALFAARTLGALKTFLGGLSEGGGLVEKLTGLFTGPIGQVLLLAAAIAGIVLLVQDFFVWMRGGKSLFGEMLGPWDKFKEKIERAMQPIKEIFLELKKEVLSIGDAIKAAIPPEVLEFMRSLHPTNPGGPATKAQNYPMGIYPGMIPTPPDAIDSTHKASISDFLRGLPKELMDFLESPAYISPSTQAFANAYAPPINRGPGSPAYGTTSVLAPVNIDQIFNITSGTPQDTARAIERISRETARDEVGKQISHVVQSNGGQ